MSFRVRCRTCGTYGDFEAGLCMACGAPLPDEAEWDLEDPFEADPTLG